MVNLQQYWYNNFKLLATTARFARLRGSLRLHSLKLATLNSILNFPAKIPFRIKKNAWNFTETQRTKAEGAEVEKSANISA